MLAHLMTLGIAKLLLPYCKALNLLLLCLWCLCCVILLRASAVSVSSLLQHGETLAGRCTIEYYWNQKPLVGSANTAGRIPPTLSTAFGVVRFGWLLCFEAK